MQRYMAFGRQNPDELSVPEVMVKVMVLRHSPICSILLHVCLFVRRRHPIRILVVLVHGMISLCFYLARRVAEYKYLIHSVERVSRKGTQGAS